MGICISLNKNKNKNKKDEENPIIKINFEDNSKPMLDKLTTLNEPINNNINEPEQEEIKKENENNIIISEQNLISISRKNSDEKMINSNNKTENNIVFTISDEFAYNSDSKRNIPYSPHIFEITNGRDRTNDNNTIYDNESIISDNQDLTYRTANITCIFCSSIFHSIKPGIYIHIYSALLCGYLMNTEEMRHGSCFAAVLSCWEARFRALISSG